MEMSDAELEETRRMRMN